MAMITAFQLIFDQNERTSSELRARISAAKRPTAISSWTNSICSPIAAPNLVRFALSQGVK